MNKFANVNDPRFNELGKSSNFDKKTQKLWILFVSLVFEPFINGIVHCDPLTLTSEGVQETLSDSKILGSTNMTKSNVK